MTRRTHNPAPQSLLPLTGRKDLQSGFTLVELIIVVGIVAILASIAMPIFEAQIKSAKIARAAGDMRTIDKEIQAYYIEKNTFPNTLNDLNRGVFLDAWKREYQYSKLPAQESSIGLPLNEDYDLYSFGPDGASANVYDATCDDDVVRAADGSYMGVRY